VLYRFEVYILWASSCLATLGVPYQLEDVRCSLEAHLPSTFHMKGTWFATCETAWECELKHSQVMTSRFALEVLSWSRLKKPCALGWPASRHGALLPPLEMVRALEGVTVRDSSYPIPPHAAESQVIEHQPVSVISPEQCSANVTCALCVRSNPFYSWIGQNLYICCSSGRNSVRETQLM